MTTAYRQPIRRGDVGSDIVTVKRALKKAGFGKGLVYNRTAGDAFIKDLKRWQAHHGLPSDGVYGPGSHKKLSPLFDAWGAVLYRRAALRTPPAPTTAAGWAKRLLEHRAKGRYRCDNPADLHDVIETAAGRPVYNRSGRKVWMDSRVFEALCHIIERGYTIGTSAMCSDHHDDGPNGHAGGKAYDISSINGRSVSLYSSAVRRDVLAVNQIMRSAGHLRPRQLISGGYGNRRDNRISAESLPGADSYYTSAVMAQHTNHIHNGF